MTVGDTNELDLTTWLESGETVLWHGADGRTQVPWLTLSLTLVVSLGAYTYTVLSAVNQPPLGAVLGVGAFIAAIQIAGALTVRRSRRLDRYVLTDRRAAVFRAPAELLSQTVISSPFFHARWHRFQRHVRPVEGGQPAPGHGSMGVIDWGESDLQRRRRGQEAMRLSATTMGIADPQRVLFAGVADFDLLGSVAGQARRRWGAETPAPVSAWERSRSPEPLGFLDTTRARRLNLALLGVAIVSLTADAVYWVDTFLASGGTHDQLPIQIFYGLVLVFLVWFAVVLAGRRQRPGQKLFDSGDANHWGRAHLRVFTFVPLAGVLLMVAVFAGAWAVGVRGVAELPGLPTDNAATHRYTENDHGKVFTISPATYDRLTRIEERVFLCGVLAIDAVAIGLCADEEGRHRRRRSAEALSHPQAEGAWSGPAPAATPEPHPPGVGSA